MPLGELVTRRWNYTHRPKNEVTLRRQQIYEPLSVLKMTADNSVEMRLL